MYGSSETRDFHVLANILKKNGCGAFVRKLLLNRFNLEYTGFDLIGKWLLLWGSSNGLLIFRVPVLVTSREFYTNLGLCQHCGGIFKGVVNKTCADCGRPKDY